jgi:hypothetical protein
MKNVWKGLVVGSFAGAAVGIALDVLERLGADTHRAAEHAKRRAEHVAEAARERAEQVRQQAPEMVDATWDRVGR